MPAIELLKPWAIRPATTDAEVALADAVARRASEAAERLPAPNQTGAFPFPGLPAADGLEAALWGMARGSMPVFAAEVSFDLEGTTHATRTVPTLDVNSPLGVAAKLAEGYRLRIGSVHRILPEFSRIHNDIVRGWHSRPSISMVLFQGATQFAPSDATRLLVALGTQVEVTVEGIATVLPTGHALGIPKGGSVLVKSSGSRALIAEIELESFGERVVLEHFRTMVGHHPLVRASLPVDGRRSPRSYAGSLLDEPSPYTDTVLEFWDSIDHASAAHAWWTSQTTLVPIDPPNLEGDVAVTDGDYSLLVTLTPCLPATPVFLADELLVNEQGIATVLAAGGHGIPLTDHMLERLAALVDGEEFGPEDVRLGELLAEAELLQPR